MDGMATLKAKVQAKLALRMAAVWHLIATLAELPLLIQALGEAETVAS
jgi:hypothetical protein